MTVKMPLVLYGGVPKQLISGDTTHGGSIAVKAESLAKLGGAEGLSVARRAESQGLLDNSLADYGISLARLGGPESWGVLGTSIARRAESQGLLDNSLADKGISVGIRAESLGRLGGSYQIIPKTTDYSIATSDVTGTKTFTNHGASANVEFVLPAGTTNYKINFMVVENYYLKVRARSSNNIIFSSIQTANDGYIRTNEIGTFWSLEWSQDSWTITKLNTTLLYDE